MEDNKPRMQAILERTNCPRHKAPKGIPCWHIRKNVIAVPGVTIADYYAAACGKRIKSAGFVGKINDLSQSRGQNNANPRKN